MSDWPKTKSYNYLRRNYIIWSKWEFMPMWFTNIPVVLCFAYYALRSRSISFFKSTNPGLQAGGAFYASKHQMMKDIPRALLPKMELFKYGTSTSELLAKLIELDINFPIILKPDIGERGFFVSKIENETLLKTKYTTLPCAMIVQEFLDLSEEYTLSFNHIPGNPDSFKITSVCQKEFMQITGDGISTGAQLMERNDRYFLQLERFQKLNYPWLDEIIPKGKTIYPEPVGNHNKGTAFLDARHLISDELSKIYKPICLNLQGVFLGRFDLKATSVQDFKKGFVKIMELNGVFGEPVHVYDPHYPVLKAYKDLFDQWKTIYKISRINKDWKVKKYTLKESLRYIGIYLKYKKGMMRNG